MKSCVSRVNLTKTRNSNIEFLRVLMMFGICACHVIGQLGYLPGIRWDKIFGCGVVGFVFISGYFGIRFRPSKFISLFGVVLICDTVVSFCSQIYGCEATYGRVFLHNLHSEWWFAWAYLILMLFAPLIEIAVEKIAVSALLPLLFLTFVWQFSLAVPCVRDAMPFAAGLQVLSFLSLIGIYFFARFLV